MSKEIKVNWIDEMIEREALPKAIRKETVADFSARHGISETTYYNHSSREENQKRSLKIALMSVKKRAPEILEKLGDKAEAGDMRATDMYLNYVLELSKNLDVKSDGKSLIVNIDNDIADKNDINTSTENNS